jgi:Helicase HerA, central domain
VHDVTRLLAVTGPLVIAVDQFDTLVARSSQLTQKGDTGAEGLLVAQIADGLMGLREVTRRTLTVLACLPNTWNQVKDKAADSVPDRFRESLTLGRITDGEVARALVAKRLSVAYREMGFEPPHATWPVAPEAFEKAWEERTPRELWKRIGSHIELCPRTGEVRELVTFDELGPQPVAQSRLPAKSGRFADLDAQFDQLRSQADFSVLLHQKSEGEVMPELLLTALRAWIMEGGDDDMRWSHGLEDGGRRELYARLTETVDEAADLKEEYWDFRAIFASHPIAVLHRLRRALGAADAHWDNDNRHLIIVRNSDWSKGTKTQEELRKFHAAGGRWLKLSKSDVTTFWALMQMFTRGGTDLHDWLENRRPVGQSDLLSTVLTMASPGDGTRPPPADGTINLGTDTSGDPVSIELSALRKHVAVFAGSGSGKTVLLRRIVEECALLGVSVIVLDPNNDLARLGDAWPEPPAQWGPGDAELAERHLAETDVVVWTPGRSAGRPLAFQPLPDFAGVLDDEDEFGAAVEVALAALAPQARLTGSTVKANIGLAVLRQAVIHYACGGSRGLPGLIEVLSDLPDDVSTLNDGRRIAAELAEVLKAAMVNDPLLAGGGTPVDPGVLLTPAEGRTARVSVISFVGLPSEEQRRNFVNQLQMELFAWVKRNPAGDRPLGALFVMDEAQTLAASGSLTASTRSTIVLASQARKYGLGLLFATQAPKGLHNQIVGNATTQFFGRLNSPAQIAAANELARAKGTAVADISGLERAQFYVSGESFGFRKTTVPLCLTHHPTSPLRLEEVIDRARRDR